MAALTASDTLDLGPMGQYRELVFVFTDVDDGDTYTLPSTLNVIDYDVAWTGNPGTQTSGGGHFAYSSSVFTFYPSTDNLGARLTVKVAN